MSNKKPTELSTEDLLKALESASDDEIESISIPEQVPPVLEFIKRFKIESGKHRVPSKALWNLYLQYYPNTITQNIFSEHANKVLKYSKSFFYLNKPSDYYYSLFVKKSVIKPKRVNTYNTHVHFGTFFKKTNVSPGNHRIPWFAFFHIYRCYCIDSKIKKPRSKQVFIAYVSNFFKSLPSDDGSLFLVDKDTAHSIEKKDYERLKKIYQKEHYTKR